MEAGTSTSQSTPETSKPAPQQNSQHATSRSQCRSPLGLRPRAPKNHWQSRVGWLLAVARSAAVLGGLAFHVSCERSERSTPERSEGTIPPGADLSDGHHTTKELGSTS
jgi:hypothetical protein